MATTPNSVVTEELIHTMVKEYASLTTQETIIKKRKKELAEFIKGYAREHGSEDDKGSFYSENDSYVFGAMSKKSAKLNTTQAILLFQSKGLNKCYELVPQIVESEVDKCLVNGDITADELSDITEVSQTFSVYVKEKEKMPEIQQTHTVLAAKKKPTLKKGSK